MRRLRRHTASTITDRALTVLYDNASRGWRRGDAWKVRAEKAEAAVARVRLLCELTIAASVRVQAVQQARDTLAALDERKENSAP